MKSARAFWLLTYLLFMAGTAQGASPSASSASDAQAGSPQAPAAPSGAPAGVPASPVQSPAPPVPATTPATPATPATQAGQAGQAGQAAAAPAPAAAAAGGEKKVTIKADTMAIDVPADKYRAKGNVRMTQNGATLLADSVIYSRLSGDALAEGHVFLEKEGDTLKGDRLSMNVVSQEGEVSNADLFVKKSNFRLRGQKIEKTGEDDYHVEKGTFTTCDGDHPSWRFEAKDIKVTLDDLATARDAVFYAGDIPLLYTPYLIFPVKTERQSGLLLPKFGHSTLKGFYWDQPYYWAISPSQDATFDVDMESSRGAGVGVDYRYMRSRGSEGSLQTFGIFDTNQNRFRGQLDEKHLELLSPDTTFASDIHLVSDRTYYLDYGEYVGDYNRQLLESSVSLDHRWERYEVTGVVRYSQDLLAPNNDATLQRFPELGFIAAGEKLGPLYFSMDSGFTNFQRVQGVTGERLDLHPRLTLYEKPAGLVDFSLYGGYRERVYNSHGAEAPGGVQDVGQADAGGSLSVPLERIYDGRLRHLLVPSVEYGFVQNRRDDTMPFFDYGDRVLGESIGSWSLTNVLTRKFAQDGGTPEYRDVVYLKLSQGYQFSGQRRDLLTLVDPGHHLTDLMLEGKVTPVKEVSVFTDSRINTVDGNLSTGNLGVEYKKDKDNSVSIAYRYSRDEVDYLEGTLKFPLSKDVGATVLERFSFDKGGSLESRYTLEYKRQCWSVILAYWDRPATLVIPGDHQITVNFTLAGIGALGPMRAY